MDLTRNLFGGLMSLLAHPFQRSGMQQPIVPILSEQPITRRTAQTERDLKSHQTWFAPRRAYGYRIAKQAMKRGGWSRGRKQDIFPAVELEEAAK